MLNEVSLIKMNSTLFFVSIIDLARMSGESAAAVEQQCPFRSASERNKQLKKRQNVEEKKPKKNPR